MMPVSSKTPIEHLIADTVRTRCGQLYRNPYTYTDSLFIHSSVAAFMHSDLQPLNREGTLSHVYYTSDLSNVSYSQSMHSDLQYMNFSCFTPVILVMPVTFS